MTGQKTYDDRSNELAEMTWLPDAGVAQENVRVFDATWWRVERVFSDLACLGRVTNDLEQFTQQLEVGGNALTWDKKLADEATQLLHTIYQTCVRYGLDGAAHVTLALEDMYNQVAQGEIATDESLFDLTHAYVTQLDSAIKAIHNGESPEPDAFESMFESVAVTLGEMAFRSHFDL
jgi:chemotaxis protein histidine kinase CheA